jgi:transketolase
LVAGEHISARVISMPPCETTGHGCHLQAAQETRGIVTAEEATLAGDLGGAVTKQSSKPSDKIKIRFWGVRSLHDRRGGPSCWTASARFPEA